MAGLRVFRTPQNQKFDYKPRYWDPKKEELEERRKRIEELERGGIEGTKTRISGSFRRGGGGYGTDTRMRQRQVLRSNVILIGVVAMLIVICYLLLQVYLPQMEEFLQ
jgi:hypothetical protein